MWCLNFFRPIAIALATAAASIAVAPIVAAHLVFPVHVTSNSMAPYVTRGDYGVATHARDMHHGDVIVFHFPFGAPTLAIKRAVLLAGDCMPSHAPDPAAPPIYRTAAPGAPCEVVPEGAVYVVGDNIGGSVDSRHFGVVPADQIVGKLVLRLPVTRWLAR